MSHTVLLYFELGVGMVHVSNIQAGARANSAGDLLSRGKSVKIKVVSMAGSRIGLSMKDVDQVTQLAVIFRRTSASSLTLNWRRNDSVLLG